MVDSVKAKQILARAISQDALRFMSTDDCTPPVKGSELKLTETFLAVFRIRLVRGCSTSKALENATVSDRENYTLAERWLRIDNKPAFVAEMDKHVPVDLLTDYAADDIRALRDTAQKLVRNPAFLERKLAFVRDDAGSWFRNGFWLPPETGKRVSKKRPGQLLDVWLDVVHVMYRESNKKLKATDAVKIVANDQGKNKSTVLANWYVSENWIKANNPPFYQHVQMHLAGKNHHLEYVATMRELLSETPYPGEQRPNESSRAYQQRLGEYYLALDKADKQARHLREDRILKKDDRLEEQGWPITYSNPTLSEILAAKNLSLFDVIDVDALEKEWGLEKTTEWIMFLNRTPLTDDIIRASV